MIQDPVFVRRPGLDSLGLTCYFGFMPRRKTPLFSDGFYHVYNRGSEKRTIFRDPPDYFRFLKLLKNNKNRFWVKILCYCLLPNHFHLLVKGGCQLSDFMRVVGVGYAMYFNKRYKRVGPLFQNRFRSKLIDSEAGLLQVSRYIHQNPRDYLDPYIQDQVFGKDRVLEHLSFYPYSSYPDYTNIRHGTLCDKSIILSYFSKTRVGNSYASFVQERVIDGELFLGGNEVE